MKKRILSILLSLAMIMALLPAQFVSAYSYENSKTISIPYPPNEAHPRIMFRSEDIAGIKANFTAENNSNAYAHFQSLISDSSFDANPRNLSTKPEGGYYSHAIENQIEAFAFDYAMNGTTESAATAYNKMITYIDNYTVDSGYGQDYRIHGSVVFHAAEVLDWCWNALDSTQRQNLYSKALKAAKKLDVWDGTNFNAQGAISGHGAENQILRDVLALGIAVYGNNQGLDSSLYTAVMRRIQDQYVPVRNYIYQSNTIMQGSEYGWYRFYFDMYAEQLTEAFTGEELFNVDDMQNVCYGMLYSRRPDGRFFTEGDVKSLNDGVYNKFNLPVMKFAANLFHNEYFNADFKSMNSNNAQGDFNNSKYSDIRSFNAVQWLIMNDVDLGYPSSNAEWRENFGSGKAMPLSYYFGSPVGKIYARNDMAFIGTTSSVQSSVMVAVEMKIGEQYAANHDHGDAGTFQIYYRGLLTGDYNAEDDYGTDFDTQYYKRTVAHNGLTIFDSTENFSLDNKLTGASNDGGQLTDVETNNFGEWQSQPQYARASVVNHSISSDNVSYIKGDLTRAYKSTKSQDVARSMVFLPTSGGNKSTLVVFDKVQSKTASQKKKFLLHTKSEPTISGNRLYYDCAYGPLTYGSKSIEYAGGRLVMDTLLPASASYNKVAGFKVDSNNNGTFTSSETYTPTKRTDAEYEPEWGRVEVSAATETDTTTFLNVLTVTGTGAELDAATLIGSESDKLIGVKTSNDDVIFFANTGSDSFKNDSATFAVPAPTADTRTVRLFGIGEGNWTITDPAGEKKVYTATEEAGVITLDAIEGTYTIAPFSATDLDTTIVCWYDYRDNDGMGNAIAAGEEGWYDRKTGDCNLNLGSAVVVENKGVKITGQKNGIALSDDVKTALNGDAFTIEFAVNGITQNDDDQCISLFGNAKSNFAIYKVANADKLYIKLPGTKTVIRRPFQNLWNTENNTVLGAINHHNIITVDRNAGKLVWYINGQKVLSTGYSTTTTINDVSLIPEVGQQATYAQIKVYSTAISEGVAASEYDAYVNPEF